MIVKFLNNLIIRVTIEVKTHPYIYILLGLILAASTFFRFFRLGPLLGFWYDQGRDALVIWDLLHYGKTFLIGPVTGIDGIYLGPFYYYLLAPFYWAGGGNPVAAAAGLSLLGSVAVFLLYILGAKVYDRRVGLLAALFYGFSSQIVIFTARWLSNPNPLPFFTLLVVLCLLSFVRGKDWYIVPASFLIGLCLQLEAASAVFFLPATVLIVLLLRRRVFRRPKILIVAAFAFGTTLLPQIYFDFRHQHVLLTAFNNFLVTEKSFRLGFDALIQSRLQTYFNVYINELFHSKVIISAFLLVSLLTSFVVNKTSHYRKEVGLLVIWVLTPLVGYLIYKGNNGYLWGYYLAGTLPVFLVLLSGGLINLLGKNTFTKFILASLISYFIFINTTSLSNYFKTGIGITLRAQLKAVDWVYQTTGKEPFNFDVYVPPQIYYAYSYLFRWYGPYKYGFKPETKLVKRLYTLAEPDGQHPQFLEAWNDRQDTIGTIEKTYNWGDITVNRRERIKYD